MHNTQHHLLLADDDMDDCLLFREALEELPLVATLITVNNGVELMQMLFKKIGQLPDVLFLDLNMPRKNGFECLSEIKENEKLRLLPVVIFSTSFESEAVNLLYQKGAQYYIRKPGEFSKLKKVIAHVLNLISITNKEQPTKDNFVLNDA